MLVEIESFLGIPYRYHRGPSEGELSLKDGINCQAFVHIVYRECLGVQLPPSMRSSEIFEDTELFEAIDSSKIPQFGDVYLFGRAGETNPRRFHLAVYVGNENGEFCLAHATKFGKQSLIWPLSRFHNNDCYERLYGIRRLK